MKRAYVIASREMTSYFYSPIAYVAITLFLLVCGIIFWSDFQPRQPVLMRHLFDSMIWLLVFIMPMLCMGLLAQEFATGTVETLMTAPVSDVEVVLGKFFGSLGFFLVLLAPTLVYVLLLLIYGPPDWGPIVTGYLGIVLVGALFISIGLFCSSLTRSQVVSAVATAAILVVITIIPYFADQKAFVIGFWRRVIDQAVYMRYSDFSKGVLDTGNLVFFIAGTAMFLFFTIKVLESRRWK